MKHSVLKEKLETLITEAKEGENIVISLEEAESIILALPEDQADEEEAAPNSENAKEETQDTASPPENKDSGALPAAKENQLDDDKISAQAKEIFEDLKTRRQKAAEGPGFGKPIPQVELAPEDVQKALDNVKGVTANFANQLGFLTHVYRYAAERTQTDISKINNGLLIKVQ